MLGELFYPAQAERERAFHALNKWLGEGRAEPDFFRDGEDGAEFLKTKVFYERHDEGPRAVGFKMFYDHARESPREKRAWDYLTENVDVRVIHLTRRNMLESFLSLEIAFQTREWLRVKGAPGRPADVPPLRLDPAECETYCNRLLAQRQWARQSFRRHPLLEVEYEGDLCRRFRPTIYGIHDFLEVPRGPAVRGLEKQARRSPKEQILNYDELREYFRHTLYEEFFA